MDAAGGKLYSSLRLEQVLFICLWHDGKGKKYTRGGEKR